MPTTPDWLDTGDALHRTFDCGDFPTALAFIVRIGLEAERIGHHPDLRNVYKTVEIRLTTHDDGDVVTGKDRALAAAIDAVADALHLS